MTSPVERAAGRLHRFAERNPAAARLARVASLAVRVDAPLLRALRLRFLPQTDAGIEADVWFSPLTESVSSQGFVFDPQIADLLRRDLAAEKTEGRQQLLEEAAQLVDELHREWPPSLRLEERVILLALKDTPVPEMEINILLEQAAAAMATSEQRGLEIARWALRALPRLPSTARATRTALLLALGASARLGTSLAITTEDTPAAALTDAAWIVPSKTLSEPTRIGVRYYDEGIEFVAPELAPSTVLELPKTSPLLVQVSWVASGGPQTQLVTVQAGRSFPLPSSATDVRLKTLRGDEFALEVAGPAQGPIDLMRACVGVELSGTEPLIGTGFFIARDFVVTFVPRDPSTRRPVQTKTYVDLVSASDRWTVWYRSRPISAVLHAWDHGLTMLRLQVEVSDALILPRATEPVSAEAPYDSVAFNGKELTAHNGRVASIVSLNLPDLTRDLSLALTSYGFRLKPGAAGGPILVNGQIVGMLVEEEQYSGPNLLATSASAINGFISRSLRPAEHGLDPLQGVPELPSIYLQRTELLRRLHENVLNRKPVAIIGPAGIGKTLLAVSYARSREARDAFPDGVAWFRFGDGAPNINPELDKQQLFVFDDVTNADIVRPLVEATQGRAGCLLTTRDPKIARALGAHPFELKSLTMEEALAVLAMASGERSESLPAAAHRIAEMANDSPLALVQAGERLRSGTTWEQILEEWSKVVTMTPIRLAIVLAKRSAEGPTLNLDCELSNRSTRTRQITRIEARLTDPNDLPITLRWTVFYQTTRIDQLRTGDAGPFDLPPGVTVMGIQFAGSAPTQWTTGTYVLELTGWISDSSSTPSFSEKRDVLITSREMAEVNRWSRASDEQWAALSDEAIGIPVQLTLHTEDAPHESTAHPWEFRISADRFVQAFSNYRELRDRSGLHDLIQRLNQDVEVTDVRIAAYILATVDDETGGAFHPIEHRVQKYNESTDKNLGNINPGDDERYRGRGYIGIEGRGNYRRISESLNMEKDLVRDPELLLDPNVAYQALRLVMLKRGLGGPSLKQFINADKADYIGARRIVTGSTVSAERFASNAQTIERFLRDSLVPRDAH